MTVFGQPHWTPPRRCRNVTVVLSTLGQHRFFAAAT